MKIILNKILLAVLITGLYFGISKLSLLLAIPPMFASPVWPAAGIALGAVLIVGWTALPFIWLGAFALYFEMEFANASSSVLQKVIFAVLMSIGPVLQAAFGKFLINRYVDLSKPIDTFNMILRFLFYAAPVSCILCALWCVPLLYFKGAIQLHDMPGNWLTWWIGDALGVLLIAPLIPTWMLRSDKKRAHRMVIVGIPTSILLAALIVLFVHVREDSHQNKYTEFAMDSSEFSFQLEKRVEVYINFLNSIRSFYNSSEFIDRNEFKSYVSEAFDLFPGIQALEWVPRVQMEERESYELLARKDGLASFSITEKNSSNELVSAHFRKEYFPVFYMEPMQGNESALGFDLGSNAARLKALQAARDSGKSTTSERIMLVQKSGKKPGVLIFCPVYNTPQTPDLLEDRREYLKGFALAVLDLEKLFDDVLQYNNVTGLNISINDTSIDSVSTLLYSNQSDGEFHAASLPGMKDFQRVFKISLPSRDWTIKFQPTKNSKYLQTGFTAIAVLMSGFFYISLLGAFLTAGVSRQAAIERFVDEATDNMQVANQKLRISEERFRSYFELGLIGMAVTSIEKGWLHMNQQLCEIFGYSEDELVQMSWTELTHPDDLEKDLKEFQRVVSGEIDGYSLDKRFIKKDGTIIHASISAKCLRKPDGEIDYFVALFQDITERYQAERARSESQERLDLALKGADLGLWDWNIQTGHITVNERWANMLGFELSEVEPNVKMWKELIHPEDEDYINKTLTEHLEGRSPIYETEHRLKTKSGEYVWVLDRGKVTEWDEFKQPKRAVGTHLDITDRKSAEEDRLHFEKQVQYSQKLESLGVMAGGVAHDFNNLLMSIIGNIDLAMLDIEPDSGLHVPIQSIEKAAWSAADLCRQMLNYSGSGTLMVEPMSLNSLVDDMSKMLDVTISKKAEVQLKLAEELPLVRGDLSQLRQVLMNLITNASESLGDGSGQITLTTREVLLTKQNLNNMLLGEDLKSGSYVMMQVEDTGCGIDGEIIEKIFDPFFTTKFTGRGLGMAAVQGIIRGHFGAITIESEVGKGSIFSVYFPVAKKESAVPKIHDPELISDDATKGQTVLVVEDEENVRMLATSMLERIGCKVIIAKDGIEGIQQFVAHAGRIDCVLLDMTMPGMDGAQTFREMLRIKPDACVILSSGYSEAEIEQQIGHAQPAGFLHKPYRLEELKISLKRALVQV